MTYNNTTNIIKIAEDVVCRYGTRDADELASAMGVTVMPVNFSKQRGVYKVIERNPFIFIKADMEPEMYRIVLLHELGHHVLHRNIATIFQEFNIYDIKDDRIEYEANLFAAEIALPDEEILAYIEEGYDASQIAKLMNSDVNLIALKAADLARRGYGIHRIEHEAEFLRHDR